MDQDFPDSLVAKNLPATAGDIDSIPGPGTKIPYATGQLSLCATTTEPAYPTAVFCNKRNHLNEKATHPN